MKYRLICPICNKRNTVMQLLTTISPCEIDIRLGTVLQKEVCNTIREYTCSNCRHTGTLKEFIIKEE